MNPKYNS